MILYCIRSSRGYARRMDGGLAWAVLEQASVFSPDRAEPMRALFELARAQAPDSEIRLLRVIEEPCPEEALPCGW